MSKSSLLASIKKKEAQINIIEFNAIGKIHHESTLSSLSYLSELSQKRTDSSQLYFNPFKKLFTKEINTSNSSLISCSGSESFMI